MNLLLRNISPYTDKSLFLGIFHTFDQAKIAKLAYIHKIESGELADKWQQQAYKKVNLESDLVIISDLIEDLPTQISTVFLVVEIAEFFGQIAIIPQGLFHSFAAANLHIKNISNPDSEQFPFDYAISEFEVGKLYCDHNELKYV